MVAKPCRVVPGPSYPTILSRNQTDTQIIWRNANASTASAVSARPEARERAGPLKLVFRKVSVHGRDHSRPAGATPADIDQFERPADFDRNRWPDQSECPAGYFDAARLPSRAPGAPPPDAEDHMQDRSFRIINPALPHRPAAGRHDEQRQGPLSPASSGQCR
jgi:hypothetical protein